MGRQGNRLTEQRLIPFEAPRDVAYAYDGPRALHRSPMRPNSCLVYSRIAVLFYADSGFSQVVGSSAILSLSPYQVTEGLPVIQEEQPVRASCASFSSPAVDRPTS